MTDSELVAYMMAEFDLTEQEAIEAVQTMDQEERELHEDAALNGWM